MARCLSFDDMAMMATGTPSSCQGKIQSWLNQVKYKMKLCSKASIPNGVATNVQVHRGLLLYSESATSSIAQENDNINLVIEAMKME